MTWARVAVCRAFMVHLPYESDGPAIADAMGGQVDFMFRTIAASYPLVASGSTKLD